MILFASLMLLDLLLLWSIIAGRGWWAFKLMAIAMALLINFAALSAYRTGDGWPTNGPPAHDSMFIDCLVVQPDPTRPNSGAIFLVVNPAPQTPVIGYRSRQGSPRLFVVPYTQTLYEECIAAKKQSAHGQALMIGRRNGHGSKGGHYIFYKLPPPHLPTKPGAQP